MARRAEGVSVPLDERQGFTAVAQEAETDEIDRDADADQRVRPRVAAADGEGDEGSEGVPGDQEAPAGKEPRQVIQDGAQVVLLAAPAVVRASASADPAEIETQDGDAGVDDRLGGGVHDLVVHRAAEQGMGVADDRGRGGVGGIRPLQHAFDAARRPPQEESLDSTHAPARARSVRRASRVT